MDVPRSLAGPGATAGPTPPPSANAAAPTPPSLIPDRRFVLMGVAGVFVLLLGLIAPQFVLDRPGANPEANRPPANPPGAEKARPPVAPGPVVGAPPRESIAAAATELGKAPENPSLSGILMKLCMGTFFVLVLCGGAAWGVSKWLRQQQRVQSNGRMQHLGSLPISRSVALHLVQVGEQQLLVGVDATGLRSVTALASTFADALAESDPPAGGVEIREAHGVAPPRMMRVAS